MNLYRFSTLNVKRGCFRVLFGCHTFRAQIFCMKKKTFLRCIPLAAKTCVASGKRSGSLNQYLWFLIFWMNIHYKECDDTTAVLDYRGYISKFKILNLFIYLKISHMLRQIYFVYIILGYISQEQEISFRCYFGIQMLYINVQSISFEIVYN